MHSKTTLRFWKLLAELPEGVQIAARRAHANFRLNPYQPGLEFKKLEATLTSIPYASHFTIEPPCPSQPR